MTTNKKVWMRMYARKYYKIHKERIQKQRKKRMREKIISEYLNEKK